VSGDVDRFLELVLSNPVNRAVLDRAPGLGVADWWLTAGAVFQTVWNCLDGRDPQQASWTNEKTSVNTRSMTQPQKRDKFNNAEAPVLAKQLGFTHPAGKTLSKRFAYFEDESRFLVVAGARKEPMFSGPSRPGLPIGVTGSS